LLELLSGVLQVLDISMAASLGRAGGGGAS